ncbi:MAG TPA: hypothetical protein PKB03_03865, partial [Baekduia sp.]|nr:hypothetical protein [Baekduia sp.]
QALGDELERPGVLEYWKSAPYVLNFMDGYQLKRELTRELDKPEPSPAVVEALKPDPGFLLPWSSVERFGSLPAANPRLSALFDATVDVDAWKLLWMPPSLPYYEPEGAYADERLQTFTKRLVFSSWHLVPRSVSLLLSYEAERRITKAFDAKARNTTKAREGRADHEHHSLQLVNIDADGSDRDLAVFHRAHAQAELGMDQAVLQRKRREKEEQHHVIEGTGI